MNLKLFSNLIFRIATLTLILGFILPAIAAFPYSRTDNSIKRVVIDAGHGGHDSGNKGTGRYKHKEKDISLEVSLMVGNYIKQNMPEVEVIYTRSNDQFVELRERTALANRVKADLFISIHCNAHTTGAAYGTETFVMGLTRENSNLELAKRENSVIFLEEDYEKNYEGYDPNNPLGTITAMISANSYLDQSVRFADLVETEFTDRVKRHSRGVKQSVLYVLDFTAMPSVLIELGFLTNKTEEDFLNTSNGKELMASAIYRAFKSYKEAHDAMDKLHEIDVPEPPVPTEKPKTTTTKPTTTKPATKPPKEVEKPKPVAENASTTAPIFKIQIHSSGQSIDLAATNFNGLEGVEMYRDGKLYKYTFGNYATLADAKNALAAVRSKGYKDAFVIALQDGKRIDPIKADKIKP